MTETENISATRTEPKKPRTRRLTAILVLAILALLGGAGFMTMQWLRVHALLEDNVAGMARDVAAFKTQTDGLDSRIAALEKSTAETQSAASQLAELTTRLDTAEENVARAADREALNQLQGRIVRLESTSPGETTRRAAAMLARANLARVAETAAPLTAALSALRAMAPEDPVLAILEPVAASPIPTRAMLIARFPDAARAALQAEYTGAAEDNFLIRFWTSLRHLIRVRRLDTVDGTTSEDRLARAQADCNRGDLGFAVQETRDVIGPAAIPLQPWLKDADARLALDNAIAEMNARSVQALAAPEPAPELSPPTTIPPNARQTGRP